MPHSLRAGNAGRTPIWAFLWFLGAVPAFSVDIWVTTSVDESNGTLNPSVGTGTSLREAILHAPDAAVIGFEPEFDEGTITLVSGQLAITKNLTLDASNLPSGVAISGDDDTRVFDIQAGKTVVMNKLQIIDGEVAGDGGGIRNAGTLTLNNCEVFSNESSDDGAGIFSSGPLTLNATVVSSNASGSTGGGLVAEGLLTLTGCTIIGNTASSNGGGLYGNDVTATITASTFESNSSGGSPGGGAIDNDNDGTMTLTGCTLSGNSADTKGGAIENDGTLSLTACTVSGNTATGNGGAIEHVAGVLTLTSCTLTGNSGDVGGAIDGDGTSTIRLYSCTVAANHATNNGGGIEETTGTFLLENTIVAANTAVISAPDLKVSGINTQLGVNLVSSTDGLGGSFSGIVTSPNLGALGNNGGETLTMLPLPGSPAIDAGGATALTVDQRGLPRVAGAAVDIGAVEVQPAGGVVTTTADSGPGSLRDAVASTAAGGTITFASALEGATIALAEEAENTGWAIQLTKNLTIDASALDQLTISTSDGSQPFHVTAGDTVRLVKLRIRDCGGEAGGAIANEGNLTLEDCSFSYNGSGNGGAIHNAEGAVIDLIRCELSLNTAFAGGAIYNAGELTMSECTLANNGADNPGGAVYNTGSFTATDSSVATNFSNYFGGGIYSTGMLSMARCTISGNEAADSGGGISGGGVFTACSFFDNSSFGDGGAIVHASGPLTLINCTLGNNEAFFYGGAVETNGTMIALSCTIHGNTAWEGGGIATDESATLTLANTIVANNHATDLGPDIRGSIDSEAGVNLLGTTGGLTGGFAGITGSPALMPLGNYGGATLTMLPLPGSRTIDAGGITPLTTDQRGFERVSGAAVDIGAVEVQPPLVVISAADSGAGTLRDTIAGAPAGSTITFLESLDGVVINVESLGEEPADHPLVFDRSLILDASGLESLALAPAGHTSLVSVNAGVAVGIVGMEFRNGWGGAVHNHGQLVMQDCGFTGNSSDEGGAILNSAAAGLTLEGCRLWANHAEWGAAIFNEGEVTLSNTVVSGNEAEQRGGGIFSSGTLTIMDSVFVGNGSAHFGAAIASQGVLHMARSTVERNDSGDSGAGMIISGDATIESSTISGNNCGGSGGGIYHGSGILDLILCTIHGNRADADFGGGVFSNGTIHVDACTIAGNRAAVEGGGIYLDTSASLTLRNAIVSGNSAFDFAPDLSGPIGIQSGVNLLGSTEGVVGGFAGITGDAMLPEPGLHGGPTLTMPPQPGSPAINAGGTNFHTVDQRGFPRVVGGTVDIGAVETGNAIPVVVVNTTADENDGIGTGNVSLRDAIAGADPGSIVSFAPALNGDLITLFVEQLTVDKNLIFDASALEFGVTVTGNVPRGFEVPRGRHVIMRGLRVANIANPESAFTDGAGVFNAGDLELSDCSFDGNTGDQGGAVHNSLGSRLLMSDCRVSDNEGQDEGGGLFNAGEAELTGCDFPSNGTFTDGAGIYNTGTLSLARCSFSGNFANFGGGGLFNDGSAELHHCEFTGNVSEGGFGGGILNSGVLAATATAICGNESRADGSGAGIGNSGSMTLSSCYISNNTVGYEGSGIDTMGPLTMTDSTVEGNRSEGDGAGIYIRGSTATLIRCTVSGNTSRRNGGGFYQHAGALALTDCTVAGNEAQEDLGGGIFSHAGTLAFTSSTVSANKAVYEGGGIYLTAGVPLTLDNTIIAGNTAADIGPDLRGAPGTQLGVNLLGSTDGVTGVFSGIVGNAMLQPLGLHGGPTLTMPPLAGSPAINAGGTTALTVDQRGYTRVLGGTVDIGAVETGNAIPLVVVDTAADENDGIGTGNVSLRDAVTGAAAGSIINFAPALGGQTITLTVDQILMDKNLSIDASSLASGLTVTGGSVVRAFMIPPGRHAVITGLTVSGFDSDPVNGGALRNEGNLDLSACILSGNQGLRGGAIYNDSFARIGLTNCTIHDNVGLDDGGGIYNGGTAALEGCVISDSDSFNSGAGIYNDGSLSLVTCLVSSGSANGGGGGIYNTGSATFDRTTFSGNASDAGFGSGVVNSTSANLAATNCTFSGNLAVDDDGTGAGIFNGGLLSLNHCTVVANGLDLAIAGGGIYNAPAGQLTLENSMVAGNSPSSASPDISGAISELSGINQVSSIAGITTLFSGVVADPMLAPLGDYGGPVPVMPPLPGSPAIEAAELLPGTSAIDQLGNPRPAGPAPDIGAVEAVPFGLLGLEDTDEDGIPDLIEPALGLTVGTDDSASDADGDGSTDAGEIGNMTDPFDPADYLRIVEFAKLPGFNPVTNPRFTISFPTFPGLTYSVEADQDLDFSGGGHTVVTPEFIATDFSATFEITLPPGRGFARARRH